MNHSRFLRSEMILGTNAIKKLNNCKVAVFGVGGVGSYVVEALVRTGVGNLIIVDGDTVAESNINRQLIADTTTVGMRKTDVAAERIKKINPDASVECRFEMFRDGDDSTFLIGCNAVVDAIDTVSSKIYLVKECKRLGIPLISSMGTGNKTDPTKLEVADIFNTSVCPLCRVMRHELKKCNIDSLKVVYSKEIPVVPSECPENSDRRSTPGSLAFVPGAAGLIIAREVIFDLLGEHINDKK